MCKFDLAKTKACFWAVRCYLKLKLNMGTAIGLILLVIITSLYQANRKKNKKEHHEIVDGADLKLLNRFEEFSVENQINLILNLIDEKGLILQEDIKKEDGYKITCKEKFRFSFHWPTIIEITKESKDIKTTFKSFGEKYSLSQSSHDDEVLNSFIKDLLTKI